MDRLGLGPGRYRSKLVYSEAAPPLQSAGSGATAVWRAMPGGRGPRMSQDLVSLFAEREGERYALHSRHLNEQVVRVLQAIGYDVGFRRGSGQYLYDHAGERYLDLLSGFGV